MSFVPVSSCFLLFTATSAFAGQSQVSGRLGDNVTLHCQAPRGFTVTVLEWTRTDLSSDDYVFLYRNARSYERYQHESFRGRVVLRDPKMRDGDISVVLNNISTSDTGAYVCCVTLSNMERFNRTVSLVVDVPGPITEAKVGGKMEKLHENKPSVPVALVLGLSAAAVVILCVGFMVFRKCKDTSCRSASGKTPYKSASEKADEPGQV